VFILIYEHNFKISFKWIRRLEGLKTNNRKNTEILIKGFIIIYQILAEDIVQELKCLKYLNNLLHTHTHKARTHMAHTRTRTHTQSLSMVNTTMYVWVTPDFRNDETWVGNTLLHYLRQPKFTLSCTQNIQRYQMFTATSTKSAAIHITTWLLKHELTLKMER